MNEQTKINLYSMAYLYKMYVEQMAIGFEITKAGWLKVDISSSDREYADSI